MYKYVHSTYVRYDTVDRYCESTDIMRHVPVNRPHWVSFYQIDHEDFVNISVVEC